jgi:hypothetical protein
MPAPIPLEPPVTRATFPVNDSVCIAAIDILLLIEYLYFGLLCPELNSIRWGFVSAGK